MAGKSLAWVMTVCLFLGCSKSKSSVEPVGPAGKEKSIVLVFPDTGGAFSPNGPLTIQWKSQGLDSVVVEYSADSGTSWITIARKNAADTVLTWTLSGLEGRALKIRVRDPSGAISDMSSRFFNVIPLPQLRSLKLLFPNGGGSFHRDSTVTVVWSFTGALDSIKLDVFTGKAWIPITASAPNSGSYAWKILPGPVDSARLRISSLDGLVQDESDLTFKIAAPPPGLSIDFAKAGGNTGDLNGGGFLLTDGSGYYTAALSANGLVTRRNARGETVWTREVPTFQYSGTYAAAMAVDGGVYVTGSFTGKGVDSGKVLDFFMSRLNADGSIRWLKQETGEGSASGQAITVDAQGNIYVAGSFNKTAVFGSAHLNAPNNGSSLFVAKYDSDTGLVWIQSSGTQGDNNIRGLERDAAGNIYLLGSFRTKLTLGGDSVVVPANESDDFVAALTPAGKAIWLRSAGPYTSIVAMKMDLNGEFHFISNGHAPSFCADRVDSVTSAVGMPLVFTTSPSLSCVWALPLMGKDRGGYDKALALDIDRLGDVYVAGSFYGTRDIGPYQVVSNGFTDVFAAKISPAGRFLLLQTGGGAYEDVPNSVATDGSGGILISGTFTTSTRFGSDSLTSSGRIDSFLVRFLETSGP